MIFCILKRKLCFVFLHNELGSCIHVEPGSGNLDFWFIWAIEMACIAEGYELEWLTDAFWSYESFQIVQSNVICCSEWFKLTDFGPNYCQVLVTNETLRFWWCQTTLLSIYMHNYTFTTCYLRVLAFKQLFISLFYLKYIVLSERYLKRPRLQTKFRKGFGHICTKRTWPGKLRQVINLR